jgi:hypothetical protein
MKFGSKIVLEFEYRLALLLFGLWVGLTALGAAIGGIAFCAGAVQRFSGDTQKATLLLQEARLEIGRMKREIVYLDAACQQAQNPGNKSVGGK